MEWSTSSSGEHVRDTSTPIEGQATGPAPLERGLGRVQHTELDRQAVAALATRMVIGQAVGIVMQRDALDADAAFARLVEVSQRTNTKLHEVAGLLVAQLEEALRSR